MIKSHCDANNYRILQIASEYQNNQNREHYQNGRALVEKYASSNDRNIIHAETDPHTIFKKQEIDSVKARKLHNVPNNLSESQLAFGAFQAARYKKEPTNINTAANSNNTSKTIFTDEELQEIKDINPFKDVTIDKEKDIVLSGFQKPIEFKYSNSYLNKIAALNNFLLSSRPSPIEKEICISILSNNQNFLEIFQELLIEIHTKKKMV